MNYFENAVMLIGGLVFFLFGMKVMSQSLEKMAGGKLRFLPLLEAFHPQIAEAVESKVRPKHLCGTA